MWQVRKAHQRERCKALSCTLLKSCTLRGVVAIILSSQTALESSIFREELRNSFAIWTTNNEDNSGGCWGPKKSEEKFWLKSWQIEILWDKVLRTSIKFAVMLQLMFQESNSRVYMQKRPCQPNTSDRVVVLPILTGIEEHEFNSKMPEISTRWKWASLGCANWSMRLFHCIFAFIQWTATPRRLLIHDSQGDTSGLALALFTCTCFVCKARSTFWQLVRALWKIIQTLTRII